MDSSFTSYVILVFDKIFRPFFMLEFRFNISTFIIFPNLDNLGDIS